VVTKITVPAAVSVAICASSAVSPVVPSTSTLYPSGKNALKFRIRSLWSTRMSATLLITPGVSIVSRLFSLMTSINCSYMSFWTAF